ncbi:unnamed protein product, partial [Ectocarpus sp. 12 AP-2014]
ATPDDLAQSKFDVKSLERTISHSRAPISLAISAAAEDPPAASGVLPHNLPGGGVSLGDKQTENRTSIQPDTGKPESGQIAGVQGKVPDNDALRAAIRNGNTSTLIMELTKVEDDEKSLDEKEKLKLVVQKLTRTYGGTINDAADGDGLFRNTSPLLHAARRGNDGVWVFLASALEKCGILGAEMLGKDARGHTVPQLAALSGNQA